MTILASSSSMVAPALTGVCRGAVVSEPLSFWGAGTLLPLLHAQLLTQLDSTIACGHATKSQPRAQSRRNPALLRGSDWTQDRQQPVRSTNHGSAIAVAHTPGKWPVRLQVLLH